MGFGFGLLGFFCSKEKRPKTMEEPCLFSERSHLDLIEDTSFENNHSHSVVSSTAYGKLPAQLNMNILARFKPLQ